MLGGAMEPGNRMRLLIGTALLLAGCATSDPATSSAPDRPRAAVHVAALDMVDAEMREHYFDAAYAGQDWGALVAEARTALADVATDEECHRVLNAMLAKLGRSHTAVIGAEAYAETEGRAGGATATPEASATPAAAGAAGAAPAPGEGGAPPPAEAASGAGASAAKPAPTISGLKAALVEGRPVVTEAEGPAAAAGLRPGFVIARIGDLDVLRLASRLVRPGAQDRHRHFRFVGGVEHALSGRPGDAVEVRFLDADGKEGTARIVLAADERPRVSVLNLPPVTPECRSRTLEGGFGYVSFDIFLLQIMPRIREAALGFARAPGVVLDLRGNPGGIGGMAMPVSALFAREESVIGTMKQRDGELRFPVAPAPRTVDAPLVVLVDERTGSTSEILAAGLQESGRALVVGTPTAGAVLPSILKTLPTGGRLQYPIADFVTSGGRTLEGLGVIPDVIVPLSQEALLAGRDNVLDAAVELLRAGARPSRKPTP